jgi:hypothetical protein
MSPGTMGLQSRKSKRSARRREPWPGRPRNQACGSSCIGAWALYMTSARVFGLSNASITGPMMAQWYMDNEARIVKAASGAAGPYVMAVNPVYDLRRAKLAYPPD